MRSPLKIAIPDVSEEDVARVANKADVTSNSRRQHRMTLDPEAARSFKQVSLTLNEFEHTTLMDAVERAGYKSAKQFVRDAMLDKALHVLEGKPYGSS